MNSFYKFVMWVIDSCWNFVDDHCCYTSILIEEKKLKDYIIGSCSILKMGKHSLDDFKY